ncbi:Hsp70 family protein [Plantactinospora sonchi]|uniref:Hsp70 family protein n=1 Tax=Plantactinospora sonchi TaxID=1544735 RepID=A0ABU7RKB3_9ACTN
MSGYRLGIDYGSSNTVAVLRWPDGRNRPLLFDGSPLLPSAVFLTGDGDLLPGRDALHSARLDPTRFEPNPKRRIDDGTLLLADRAVSVGEAVAATLRRIAEEAVRAGGDLPDEVVVGYPAGWGAVRRNVVTEATVRAGLPAPTLVPEPVAAAGYFTAVLGHAVRPGHLLVVYDLGAGTFDVSVVRRTGDGFEVCEVDGLADLGGLDLDALVVERVAAAVRPGHPQEWQRVTAPADPADRRHFLAFWEDARTAKEMLSRQPHAGLYVPLVDREVSVSREEFEALARPYLERAATLTGRLMSRAGVDADNLAGVFLVGGASRVPLAATTLHQVTGVAPTVLEQPEIVVAEGALHAVRPPHAARATTTSAPVSATPVSGSPVSAVPLSPAPVSGSPVSAVPLGPAPTSGPPTAPPVPVPYPPVPGQPVSAWPTSHQPGWVPGGPGPQNPATGWPGAAPPHPSPHVQAFQAVERRPVPRAVWIGLAVLVALLIVPCAVSGQIALLASLAGGIVIALLLRPALRWRPRSGSGFIRTRPGAAVGGTVLTAFGVAGAFMAAVFTTVTLVVENDQEDLRVLAVAVSIAAGVGLVCGGSGVGLLLRSVRPYPRLWVDSDGIGYQPDRGHRYHLPWSELVRVDLVPLRPGLPPALVAVPAPTSSLHQDPAYARLRRPELGALVVDDLPRLIRDPNLELSRLTGALARHRPVGAGQPNP